MYYSGRGVPQDYGEAARWFGKSAEQGQTAAQKNLGAMYGKGEGLPQSHFMAYVWLDIAARSGAGDVVGMRNFAASKLSPEDLDAAKRRAATLYGNIQRNLAKN